MERDAAHQAHRAADQTDMDLARRLRDADPAAHAQLCDQFGAALHGFAASRLMGDRELAEDVMIQTLADAVRSIECFEPGRASLGAWLYGIARRKIQGERRKLLRRKSVPAGAQTSLDDLNDVGCDGDMAEGVASRLGAAQTVARLSRALSDDQMEALVLHYVEGFSTRDIAEVLKRSPRAVNSLLHWARAKAREALSQADE